jgi:hypothetical protein
MIHVEPAPEPPEFDAMVREPGLRAVAEMVGKKPSTPRAGGQPFQQRAKSEWDLSSSELPTYWTRCLDALMTAYDEVCAYSCFRIHRVTGARSVDHFAPRSRRWDRVYEWANYRLACSRLNARKRDFTDILDPFEVQTGWFRLELVGFQLYPSPELDADLATRIQHTCERLGLNDYLHRESRERDAERYWSGGVTLAVLREESPLVAAELTRQGRLRSAKGA